MNILKALKAFNKGKRIYRLGWDHNETLGFETHARFVGGFPSGAYMSTPNGCTLQYDFTIEDLLSTDWSFINGARR